MIRYTFLLCLLALLTACKQQEDNTIYTGYIEGDYRFIAAPSSGWLTMMPWQNGDIIRQDEQAFTLDDTLQTLALAEAQTRITAADGQLEDLQHGERAERIANLRAQRNALYIRLDQAERDARRDSRLAKQGAVSKVQAQQEQTTAAQLRQQVVALDADIAAAKLPARNGQLKSGLANLQAANVAVAKAKEVLQRRKVNSHFDGKISAIYAHTGEWVTTGQPILKILPINGGRKIIFYVPEQDYARWQLGDTITISGDGIPKHNASISHISDHAVFTPPVIYSEATRSKLIFRLEARLDASLPIGLPVSVIAYE